MDILRAALLGLIQGTTEFLPISSSGHLLIARHLFDWHDASLLFDILLHCATLLVIIYTFRGRLISLIRHPTAADRSLLLSLMLTTLITALIGALAQRFLPLRHLRLAAAGYAVTTLLIALVAIRARIGSGGSGRRRGDSGDAGRGRGTQGEAASVNWKHALLIGLFQGIAVLPGVSRAGATIMIARLCGVERERAFEYSFLASIPAILGALLLQLTSESAKLAISPLALCIGGIVAVGSGAICLRLLRYLNINNRMATLLPYLIILTILCFTI